MLQEFNYHTRAMGCDFDMTFIAHSVQEADAYFTRAVEIATFYEHTFSRFEPQSELSRLNTSKTCVASATFLRIYHIAQDFYTRTHGAFNPLLQVRRIGYDQSFDVLEKEQHHPALHMDYDTHFRNISLKGNVLSLHEGHHLDFGGFLKGYVVEKIAHDISACHGLVINIGGDLYTKGYDHTQHPFMMEIVHPTDATQNVTVPLVNRALCTSGTYKRTWTANGTKMHHIIDPHTKHSADTDVLFASVIDKNGALADALATVAVTYGARTAETFLTKHHTRFLIIRTNGAIIQSSNLTSLS